MATSWSYLVTDTHIAQYDIVLGVVLGRKDNKPLSSQTPHAPQTSSTVNSESAVGGYLSPDFYSTSGAWNGTGIALSFSDPNSNWHLYLFYQDYTGSLVYGEFDGQAFAPIGTPVNQGSYKPMNGTPISTVGLLLGNILEWHLFYVDEDYYFRERIMRNGSSLWTDGPLSKQNLKTFTADRVGMSACYWGNYYGEWSYDATQVTAGITVWYASSETTVQQYSWMNGTNTWVYDQQYLDVNGHASFGCQTWYDMVSYIFFVNANQEIDFYWKDNNRTANSTKSHPIGLWTQGHLDIQSVYKASPIAYTNYLVFQSIDTSIRGFNITFAAENTTVAAGTSSSGEDHWILTNNTGAEVKAMGGTQLSITAVVTASNGAVQLAFLQERGDDISLYSRDAVNESAPWLKLNDPV